MPPGWSSLAILGSFVALLVVVAILRVRHSVAVIRWAVETMDGSTRWVGGLALVPGVAVAVVGIAGGWPPPLGILLGLVSALGTFVALLGVLGLEGMLLERDSEARVRIAERRPPPSSPRGRAVALVVGTGITALGVSPLLVLTGPP